MRLIDADELKKCAIPCEVHNGALTDLCVPLYQINNAPTVEYPFYQEAYQTGYEEGQKDFERPQGETNAEIFKQTFGIYATELWSMKEADFLEWLNAERGKEG